MAVKGERVLGVVTKTGRVHKVDIGTAHLASLPELAFQGATRRNKPALQVPHIGNSLAFYIHNTMVYTCKDYLSSNTRTETNLFSFRYTNLMNTLFFCRWESWCMQWCREPTHIWSLRSRVWMEEASRMDWGPSPPLVS